MSSVVIRGKGIQGPAGPAGPQGARGPDGAQGPPGQSGQGYTNRGTWAPSTAYNVDDVVQYAPAGKLQTYVCNTAHSSSLAFTSDPYWTLWAQAGADGINAPTNTYFAIGNNLSEIQNTSTARGNLGLGSAATHPSTDFDAAGAAAAAQAASQPVDSDLTAIAALDSAQSGAIASDGSGWVRKTYSQLKTALGLTKSDVGLSSVDNTADANKPISAAAQTALNAKRTRFNDRGTQNAAVTLAAWDSVTYDLTSGSITQALPSSPAVGDEVEYYVSALSGSNTLTLTGTGGPFTISVAGHGAVARWTGSAWVERQDRKTKASLDNAYARYFFPSAYGAKGDGRSYADGALTNSSTTFTSASTTFTAADIGKQILIMVVADTTTHATTIAGWVDAHTITLAAAPSATVANAHFVYGTDDTAAIQAAIDAANAAGGGAVMMPVALYLTTGITMKEKVTLTSEAGMYGYSYPSPVTLLGYADGCTVIDTPVGAINSIAIEGITIQGAPDWQAPRASIGIKWRNVSWSGVRRCLVKGTKDQGIQFVAGIAPVLEDVLVVNTLMTRDRGATPAGAVELVGCTDAFINRVEAGCGQNSVSSGTTNTNAFLVSGNGNFFTDCVGESADTAWQVTGRLNSFSSCRADLSFLHGWQVLTAAQSGHNTFVGCLAWDNGRLATNTYSGWHVTSLKNSFSGCRNFQDGSGTWNASSKYAFEDTSTPTSNYDRNTYTACSGDYSTAQFYTDGAARNVLRTTNVQGYTPTTGKYATPLRGKTTTSTPPQNVMYLTYLPLAANGTLDRIGVEVTTATASTDIRLGVYADVNGVPSGAPLVDTGAVATTATGAAEATISVPVSAPGVWLASVRQSASGTAVRTADIVLVQPNFLGGSLTAVTNDAPCCYLLGGTTGALPSINPATLSASSFNAIVAVRFA